MRIDKVILRSVLSTIAAMLVLCALLLTTLCLAFPSTMMKLTYDLGFDGASIDFASTAYDRSGGIYYAAYATEVAIGAGDDGKIVSCGKAFIEDDEFSAYASARNKGLNRADGTYQQYIYGKICVSEYRLGNSTLALNDAQAFVSVAFPASNALVALTLETIKCGDEETATAVLGVLRGILDTRGASLNSEQLADLTKLIAATENWLNG